MPSNLQSLCFILYLITSSPLFAQSLKIPDNATNFKCSAGRSLGPTDIYIKWNAPGVKGREGKIFGSDVAPFGMNVLGFGSDVASPWRAGADECTTISFSTPVKVNGQHLAAGQYAFFVILGQDSVTLIFNKNILEWGSYFYDQTLDVLRVKTSPIKNMPTSRERLEYIFKDQKEDRVTIALEWEYWSIPFLVETDIIGNTLASIKSQMSGGMGFEPTSLIAAAKWCLNYNTNLSEAYQWIDRAVSPSLGGVATFEALFVKAGILQKLGKKQEADKIMAQALEAGNALELHLHGRQLLTEKKVDEAMIVFLKNHQKHQGAWPSNVGLMRGYSAKGDFIKALEYARLALPQAPDDVNKRSLETAIKTLESGKAI